MAANIQSTLLRVVCLGAVSLGLGVCTEAAQAPAVSKSPNILIILADDLGAEALGCYGGVRFLADKREMDKNESQQKTTGVSDRVMEGDSFMNLGPVNTPNLDTMAQQGMRFDHCFATPVCSPSRAELLTGKYNHRIGFPHILGALGATKRLDEKAHPTLANRLKTAGYVTAAVGKWHLGPMEGKDAVPKSAETDTTYAHPRECGFERQCLFTAAHLELYGKPKPGEYTPERLQKWVLHFLESRREQSQPFFLYYALPLPHYPFLATPLNPDGRGRDVNRMQGDPKNFPYLVEYLDQQTGEILRKLDELKLRENTLVIFTGDNGTPFPIITQIQDGRRIQHGKGSMRDAGALVPFIASWPGRVAAGSVYDGLVDYTDIVPTCLELAGLEPAHGIDGMSLAPQLKGQKGTPRQWVNVSFMGDYYIRNAAYKLRGNGALYDVSGPLYQEKLVPKEADTAASKAAREELRSVADRLHPASAAKPGGSSSKESATREVEQ